MLTTRKIYYQIGTKGILKDITFSAEPGQVIGIVGPNGAGKTSLLKVLTGQIESHQTVFWNDKPIEDFSGNERASKISVVHQVNHGVFALTLEQIVMMGRLPHQRLFSTRSRQDRIAVNQAIDHVGLGAEKHRRFDTLSGGEQQRGLIARALAQEATTMILDEPINHLDVFFQHQILGLLQALAKSQGMLVLLSLHNLELASQYCDQLALMHRGELLKYSTPKDVLTSPLLSEVFSMNCDVQWQTQPRSAHVRFTPNAPSLHVTKAAGV